MRNTKFKGEISNIETQTTVEGFDKTIDQIDEKSMKTGTIGLHIPWLLRRCFRGFVTREWWSAFTWVMFETFVLMYLRQAGASGWIIIGSGITVGLTVAGRLLAVLLAATPRCCCCCCCCSLRRVASSGTAKPRWIKWAMAASLTVPILVFGLHAAVHGPPRGIDDACDETEQLDWFAWERVVADGDTRRLSRSYFSVLIC